MVADESHGVTQAQQQRGVVLDTNLLLLLWAGRWNPKAVSQLKCTSQFDEDDYWRLEDFLCKFRTVVVTPNILTEGSNLIRQSKFRRDLTSMLVEQIPLLEERPLRSVEIVQTATFIPLGLTDAGIMSLARERWLVLTEDFDLIWRLNSEELPVVNFNYLRSLD